MTVCKKVETAFMGILNVTPDSFSDGGRFVSERRRGRGAGAQKVDIKKVLEVAREMLEDGATYLDVGGESTGPGSSAVSADVEILRVVPAVRALQELKKEFPQARISVDTWKSEVAEAALREGADMINDVTAGRGDPRIFKVCAEARGGAGVPMVLMYCKDAGPRTTREAVRYDDVMATVKAFLEERVRVARAAGVRAIIVDPGMGAFVSGIPDYSYEIISRVGELRALGCPILVGTSRKGFLGATPEEREVMTFWTALRLRGKVDILRVHSVVENVSAVG
jgi:dihydropteroate synthase